MNVEEMTEWIAAGDFGAVESAWLAAAEADVPVAPEAAAEVLAALVAADQAELAETLGWALLEERKDRLAPPERLELAKAMALAVPGSDELRQQICELYELVFREHEHLEALLRASDILTAQTPRRALTTLDLCLRIEEGTHLANRFQNQILRVRGYDPGLNEFELEDLAGTVVTMEPRKLADEFERIDETDFRVLSHRDPERLGELLDSDPAAVLVGICQSREGQIDSSALKELLVPRYLPKEKWSSWWNRARTAAKRCEKLSIGGRHPIIVSYHRDGLSLEDELAPEVDAAKTPLAYLELIQRYVREARQRKVEASPAFAAPIIEALAEEARSFLAGRPADALAASLALAVTKDLGMPAPAGGFPSPDEVLASTDRPAEAVAALESQSLWPGALAALGRRDDVAEQLAALLELAPVEELDEVAGRVRQAGRADAIAQAAAKALADPRESLELCLWLWAGPAEPVPDAPSKLEVFSRLLKALQDVDMDWDMDRARKKAFQHRIRSAFSAKHYEGFRQVVGEMDEVMASIVKNRIERTDGLAESVHDDMLNILRESFYQLFVKAKVEPWLEEGTLWTTEAAMHRYEAELKELVEVKIPANSRAIGEAAEHGDLWENSEWKFAVEERNKLQARQAKMQADLLKARIIRPDDVPTDSVGIGSHVHLRRLDDEQQVELSLLGPWDTDLERRHYSYLTALAQGLLGKTVGDTVTLKLDGREGEYSIESLGAAEL